MYLMIEFPTAIVDNIPHHIIYFEKNGDKIYQFRAQVEIVTVPDYEILQVLKFLKQTECTLTVYFVNRRI